MLALKPKFIRKFWYNLTSQSSQLGFSSPMSLLSKGIHIREYIGPLSEIIHDK